MPKILTQDRAREILKKIFHTDHGGNIKRHLTDNEHTFVMQKLLEDRRNNYGPPALTYMQVIHKIAYLEVIP